MQKVLRPMLVVLAALAGMIPAGVGATTLTHDLVGAPLCLSTSFPTACNAGVDASQPSHSFSFDLSGILADPDEIITAASLTLLISDDSGARDGSEKIDLFLDDVDMLVNADANHDLLISLDLGSLGNTLNFELGAQTGDYFFWGATLTLTVEDRPEEIVEVTDEIPAAAAVPVPPSLVLLGLGLVAVAARRRA